MSTLFTFEHLIAPLGTTRFLDEYLEQQPLFQRRNDPSHLDGLFGLRDVEEYLFGVRPQRIPGALSVVKHGSPPMSLSAAVGSQTLYNAFRDGASLVLNRAHECHAMLAHLVKSVENELACDAQVNVYCSPPEAQGFAVHTDRHDVIVAQTYGSKLWRLYETQEPLLLEDVDLLELKADRSGVATVAAGQGGTAQELWGDPIDELLLQPGDVLYLPRGVPHAAVATDSGSLHLTIGLFPVRWHVLLRNLVDAIAAQDVELRRRVPLATMRNEEPIGSAAELCDWLASRTREAGVEVDCRRLLESVRVAASSGGPDNPAPAGYLESLLSPPELEIDSCLEFRRPRFQWLQIGPRILLSDGVVSLAGPPTLAPVAEFFTEQRRFRVGDLPSLSDSSRLVLCRRMLREGFLRLVPANS